jgi:hypothetical protein
MNKYLLTTSVLCLLVTTPALAQTATGTGVGVANSESKSAAGAVAISGAGGRGGNSNSSLTINNPANTTSTVNTNLSGTTTSNINSNVSGSTRVETVASGTVTTKNVPSMVAPGLAAAGLETCLGSASGTVSLAGVGIGGGSTYRDEDCTARLDARTLYAMGLKAASVARLCARPDIWRSMPDVCQRYWPVGQPLPAGLVVVTPEVTSGYPLVAPRRQINNPNYGYEQPYAMGGTSIEVIDGKTGLTRPCNEYNSVRLKCLNWADGKGNIKLAAKPKKSATVVVAVKPAPATAAGNPVTASVATPKKED